MADLIGAAAIRILADASDFNSELEQQTVSKTSTIGSKISKGLGKVLKRGAQATGLAVGTTLTLAIGKGFKRLTAIEDAEAKLAGLGHSTEGIAKIMDNALAAVEGTAYGLGDAASQAATLVAAGVKPGDDLTKTLTTLADTASIAGADINEMGAIFGKVAARGRVTGEEIAQLQNRGIPILQMIADEYGVTAEEASKMVTEGKVDFEKFQKILENNIGGAAQKAGQTFSGAFANMGAALGRFGAKLLSGVFAKMPDILATAIDALDGLAPAAEAMGQKAGDALATLFDKVLALRPVFEDIAGVVKTAFTALRGGEVDAGWATKLQDVAQRVVELFHTMRENVGRALDLILPILADFGSKMAGVATLIMPLVRALGQSLLAAFRQVVPFIKIAAVVIGAAFYAAIKALPPVLTAVIKSLTWLLNVTRPLMPVIQGVGAALIAWKVYTLAAAAASKIHTAVTRAQDIAIAASRTTLGTHLGVLALNTKEWLKATAVKIKDKAATVANTVAAKASVVAEKLQAAVKKITLRQWAMSAAAKAKDLAIMVAHRTATIAAAVAQKAMAAAQWLLNAAMTANPIGIVVAAIALLVAGLVLAYRKSDTFRAIVDAAFKAVAAAGVWLWNNALKPAFNGIRTGFQLVGAALQRVWSGLIRPMITNFVAGFRALWAGFKSVTSAVGRAWQAVANLIRKVWTSVIRVQINAFRAGFAALRNAFSTITAAIRRAWSNLGNGIRSIYNGVIRAAFNLFRSGINGVRTVFSSAVSRIRSLWSGMGKAIRSVWTGTISTAFSALKSGVGKIKSAFSTGVAGIKSAWNKLKGVVKSPVTFAVNTVMNKGLIGGFNTIARKLPGVPSLPSIPWPPRGWKAGGSVFGKGAFERGGRDRIPALLDHDEHVWTRDEVRKAGGHGAVERLRAMARRGVIPALKAGGRVWPVKGSRAWTSYPGHTGIDFPRSMGTPVFATENGTIAKAAKLGVSYGWHYFLRGKSGISTIYAHLSKMIAKAGQTVTAGAQIGNVGSTGNSTGPHLHFETRPGGTPGAAAGYLGGAGTPKGGVIGSVLGAFKSITEMLTSRFKKPLNRLKEITDSPFGKLAAGVPRHIADKIKSYAKDKIKFDTGGLLQPGLTLAHNQTGKPERVLTDKQWRVLEANLNNQRRGPVKISGTLDMGNGLRGFVEGVLDDAVADAMSVSGG